MGVVLVHYLYTMLNYTAIIDKLIYVFILKYPNAFGLF